MKRTLEITEKVEFHHELKIEFDGTDEELENILSKCDNQEHVDDVKIKLLKHGVTLVEFDEDGNPNVEVEITDVY